MNKLKALDILDSLQADIYATELYSMQEISEFLRFVQEFLENGKSVVHCRNCIHWDREDKHFRDFDEKQWHSCPYMGIKDVPEYFYCREGEKPKR